jgi:penicillin-binding protein 1C
LESLASAFTCFARNGLSGKLRFFEDEPLRNRYMMSEAAAWMVRNILENNPGPGHNHGLIAIPEHRKIAWKTGTSYGFRDAWAIGSSNSFTVGVWAGRPDGTPIPGHYGAITAAPILFSIFDTVLTQNNGKISPRPDSIVSADICWPLGLALLPGKEHLCHVKHTAWAINGVIPPTFADRNQKTWISPVATIWINPETNKQVNPDCPINRKMLTEIPRWPLILEPWLSAELRLKASFPTIDPVCGIIPTPEPGTIKLTGLSSGNTLRRAGALNNAPKVDLSVIGARQRVFWLINSELTKITSPQEVFAYRFDRPGQYEITVMDSHGNFDSVDIHVMD